MTWQGNSPISRELADFWKESESLQQQFWREATTDVQMATGQQDTWNNGFQNHRNQRLLQFNKILRILNMIGGYQRDNRLASIAQPADNEADLGETADQRTTALQWAIRRDNTYERISDCFDASNMSGQSLLHIWMDYREDPESGEVCTDRFAYSAYLMDPYFEKQDLSDCQRIWTRKYLTKRQLLGIFPDLKKDIPFFGKGYAARDGKFPFMQQNWMTNIQELYAYDEYWVKDYRKTRKLLDTSSGEVVEWKGTRDQFQLLKQYNPNVQLISAQKPTIRQHILVNGREVYEEKSPYGLDRLPFALSLCYFYPEVQNYSYRFQGIPRAIRDSQIELNRRRNKMLDILDAQIQSGLMVKEDALVNPEDAFMQGPGKVLFFKKNSNLASDVAPMPPPPVAQGWMELIQTIEKEIMDIVGPEELFAQNLGEKDMSGIMMKLKMGAGLTGLRNLFDRLNMFQVNVTEIMQDLIVNNFSFGKVKQILGKEPTEAFFDQTFSKYHISVEEGELTASQRQLKFMQALHLKQIIPESIDDAYLLENSTLQGKKQLVEASKARAEQMQKMQMQQAQQAMEQQAILTRSIEAKSQNDFASAEERQARAVSDIALAKERVSQAVHDRAAASLDNARALKELGEMDENRLMKLADFIINLQERQKAIAGNEEGDSIEEASSSTSEIRQQEKTTRPKESSLASSLQQ